MRSYERAGLPEKIRAAGGEIYAVTSEPQALASKAPEAWELSFESVGDPHHEISGTCRERGWLALYSNDRKEFLEASAKAGWKPQHPKGYFQPGVIALASSGRVLYRWRSVPTHKNVGGALERPTGDHVWSEVSRALEGAPDAGDAALDAAPPLDSRAPPWPLFVALLVANGWFVHPRGFEQRSRGSSVQTRLRIALLRGVLFAAAWITAFVTLPALAVAAALALWIAWITPQIRWLNREFQDASA